MQLAITNVLENIFYLQTLGKSQCWHVSSWGGNTGKNCTKPEVLFSGIIIVMKKIKIR